MENWGLEEILNEAEAHNWPAREIAGRVLARCCVTEGKFNNFQVGLLAVMTFLNDQFGSLGTGAQQAFQDLVQILYNPGTPRGDYEVAEHTLSLIGPPPSNEALRANQRRLCALADRQAAAG
jgi:hypothetical protein